MAKASVKPLYWLPFELFLCGDCIVIECFIPLISEDTIQAIPEFLCRDLINLYRWFLRTKNPVVLLVIYQSKCLLLRVLLTSGLFSTVPISMGFLVLVAHKTVFVP